MMKHIVAMDTNTTHQMHINVQLTHYMLHSSFQKEDAMAK